MEPATVDERVVPPEPNGSFAAEMTVDWVCTNVNCPDAGAELAPARPEQ